MLEGTKMLTQALIALVSTWMVLAQDASVCQDNNPKCRLWKDLCNDPENQFYMETTCTKTCDLCPKCEDKVRYCLFWKRFCKDRGNAVYMKENCALTCGFCKLPPPVPPTVQTVQTVTHKVIPAGPCGVSQVLSGRVVNGADAKPGAWPWQVLIRFIGEPHCGGSIINPFWILTAAHCIEGKEPLMDEFKVITGEHNYNVPEGRETSIGVSKLIYHENYNKTSLGYDIALMKLDRPIPFNKFVATVCLPQHKEEVPIGTNCFITGWGKLASHLQMHPILQQAKLPVVENQNCHTLNNNFTNLSVSSEMVCAGFGPANPTGGCHGDSGGPFVCPTGRDGSWVLHGAVSWGSGKCDTSEAYTVFARLSEFRRWIDKNIADN